jgi:hypothetical protein
MLNHIVQPLMPPRRCRILTSPLIENYINLGTNGYGLARAPGARFGSSRTTPFDIKRNIQTVIAGVNYRF